VYAQIRSRPAAIRRYVRETTESEVTSHAGIVAA
jgi:hypothetical protein